MTEAELFKFAEKNNLTVDGNQTDQYLVRIGHALFGPRREAVITYLKTIDGRRWIYLNDAVMKSVFDPDRYTTVHNSKHTNLHEITEDYLDKYLKERLKKFDEIYLASTTKQIRESGNVLERELSKLAGEDV